MSSWFSSWIPSIPIIDFSLPSTIQRRFISFLLRKTLGHFLRPGQLDIHQVDSQIGSGHVQVNDLELDNQAINTLLQGLPLELYDGSIGSVTARIPWPNPLTSTLGLSLRSLHLTFHLVPTPPRTSASKSDADLADSVASVAESFVHDELTPREEASLRESIYSEVIPLDDDHNVPGGLNPFLAEPDDTTFHSDSDPTGVSIFAVLIERLLARFECDATDLKLTLVSPGESSFTFSIGNLSYAAEPPKSKDQGLSGETRNVTIRNVAVTTRDLRSSLIMSPALWSPRSQSAEVALYAKGASPASSTSSLDEDTQLMMSQSIASLPQRPGSPSPSAASSMYESAISTAFVPARGEGLPESTRDPPVDSSPQDKTSFPSAESPSSPRQQQSPTSRHLRILETLFEEDTILSCGSEPIIIRLTTPPPTPSLTPQEVPTSSEGTSCAAPQPQGKPLKESLKFSVTSGVIAGTLRAGHVRAVLDTAERWSLYQVPELPSMHSFSPTRPPSSMTLSLDALVQVKGIVLLVLPSLTSSATFSDANSLRDFYAHPLVPPPLSYSYVRLHVESILCSLPLLNLGPSPSLLAQNSSKASPIANTSLILSVSDVSIFAVQQSLDLPAANGRQPGELLASPVLITDPLLPSQNIAFPPASDSSLLEPVVLPEFTVLDYTDKAHWHHGVRPSFWRTKPKQKGRPGHTAQTTKPQPIVVSSPDTPPCSAVQLRLSRSDDGQNVEIEVVPLHIFLDLGQVLQPGGVMTFVDEISRQSQIRLTPKHPTGANAEAQDEDGDTTPPATPSQSSHNPETVQEWERRRLEKIAMEGSDLDLDYRTSLGSQDAARPQGQRSSTRRKSTPANANTLSVKLSLVRIQARCPSPPRYSKRSGVIVLDLLQCGIYMGLATTKPCTKFVTPDDPNKSSLNNTLASLDCGGITIGVSLPGAPRARVLFSTTTPSLPEDADELGDIPSDTSPCRLVMLKPGKTHEQVRTLSVVAELPSVRAVLPKDLLDGVQYWADDASQLMESVASAKRADIDSDTERAYSRDASLIGSRFFAKSRSASTVGSDLTVGRSSAQGHGEVVVKLLLSEAHLIISLPRSESSSSQPLVITASEIDALLEFKAEGKDQTVLTLGVMNVTMTDYPKPGTPLDFLSLTTPRAMAYASRPIVKLRFSSLTVSETASKETRVHLTLCGFTFTIHPDFAWVNDLVVFAKAPPGAFESVIPSERTKVAVKVSDGSFRALAPSHPGAILLYIGDLAFSTVVGESSGSPYDLRAADLAILAIESLSDSSVNGIMVSQGVQRWKSFGYALLSELPVIELSVLSSTDADSPNTRIGIERIALRIHLCADTMTALTTIIADMTSTFNQRGAQPKQPKRQPSVISEQPQPLLSSVEEHAFSVNPEVGSSMDMIKDDLPTNAYYLDEHFGSAAGLRELRDDDLDDFDDNAVGGPVNTSDDLSQPRLSPHVGSETVKVLKPQGIHIVENYFDDLPAIPEDGGSKRGPTTLQVRINNGDVTLLLYDGYDWARTRRVIEEEVREMRRRLAKIRQLVASGQLADNNAEETSAILFNSMYIGLERDPSELDPGALIAAIDEELKEDTETASQSSWESLMPPTSGKPQARPVRVHGRKLTRSKRSRIEICLMGLSAEVDKYRLDDPTVSRTFITVKDAEILDHIKTSTWKKFLTSMRVDSKGVTRESGSNMIRIELLSVHPVVGHPSEEARLKAKILPLRLYVDQDALDFLKKFFSFKDPEGEPASTSEDGDAIFFQHAEVFPVDLKLDYKPRRVDYRALREGRTIELMNFFHFDGAEMTLRHITLSGITGWPRFFDLLNDLWTPDVKATQLMDVISGVSPIRSVVNVGSGVADLVLLPIAQFKKDGRLVRGMQRGANSFVKSTAMEAIKLGARLATGTQVILEHAEGVIGGRFDQAITAETLQPPVWDDGPPPALDEDDAADLISKYAEQPTDIKEGVQSAYKSLRKNLSSAAQTILAVPMEVYERPGDEGPIRAVIRAVPIAVLKPMIGASEAISKTLMGLHNTLDPNIRYENEEKYKQR